MKKIIAIFALMLMASSAFAQTKKEEEEKPKTFADNLSFWAFLIPSKSFGFPQERDDAADSSLWTLSNLHYQDGDKYRFGTQFQVTLNDSNTDRFREADFRIYVDRFVKGYFFNRFRLALRLPTNNDAQAAQRIVSVNVWAFLTPIKLNDYNVISGIFGLYNKTFLGTGSDNSAGDFSSWQYFRWTNTSLSDKYRFAMEFNFSESGQILGGGEANNFNITASKGSGSMLAGVVFDALKTNWYPYIQHNFSRTKAFDQLGVGVQIFKSF